MNGVARASQKSAEGRIRQVLPRQAYLELAALLTVCASSVYLVGCWAERNTQIPRENLYRNGILALSAYAKIYRAIVVIFQ